jgi:inorganic pyrophosphatase
VPVSRLTRRYENVQDYFHLPEITTQQIEHFFTHYKDLEPGKFVNIEEWGDAAAAEKLVQEAIEREAAAAH